MRFRLDHAAFAFCGVNPLVALAVVTWDSNPMELATQVLAFLLMAPIMSWLQISAALLVRRLPASLFELLLLLLSLAAAIDYVRFVFSVDLAGSPTAGVALILYPLIRQPLWALPIGAGLVWLARRRST
jgi:hypothetical protein